MPLYFYVGGVKYKEDARQKYTRQILDKNMWIITS